MTNLLLDLRYAIRMLRKTPAFTAIAILSIALAIGLNSAVFTWVKALILQPLPGVRGAHELVNVMGIQGERNGLSHRYSEYLFYREQNSVFSGLIAYEFTGANLSEQGNPELIYGGTVSANYFDVLGVRPLLGRGFLADDEKPGASPAAVISFPLWQQRFAGNADVIGKTVSLNSHPFTIIGVAPPKFVGTYGGLANDFWVLIVAWEKPGADVSRTPVQMMGRLKSGMTLVNAQADMHLLAKRLAETGARRANWDLQVFDVTRSPRGLGGSLVELTPVLMAFALLILLIACANIANLLLARATVRSKEMGIRLALGASRRRVIRQLLTESILLSVAGGVVGLLLATWAAKSGTTFFSELEIPLGFDLGLDYRVMLFTFVVVLLTGIFFGLLPAVHTTRPELVSAIKDQGGFPGRGAERHTVRNTLMVAQIALSVIALVASGLFIRSLRNKLNTDPGFNPENLVIARFDLSLNNYDTARGKAFYNELMRRVRSLPGIQSVSLTSYAPISGWGGGNSRRVEISGYVPRENESLDLVTDDIGPDYLHAMQIPLAQGRDFSLQDNENSTPVAIINETMAQRFWPNQNPIGKQITISKATREIVGVAKNSEYRFPGESPQSLIYLAALQDYSPVMILVARTERAPEQALPAIRQVVKDLDAGVPLIHAVTFTTHIRSHFSDTRMMSVLLSTFAGLSLLLTSIGLYGVISYFVTHNTREIGIRMALGASGNNILVLVLVRGIVLVSIGLILGILGSISTMRVLANLLYGVHPSDAVTLFSVALLLSAIALLATYLPARRAAHVDPMVALRYE